jgi:HD-GYP domain-containing protein (c-di-GMP phosphodiesterase class II)
LHRLRQAAGSRFDPEVVELLAELLYASHEVARTAAGAVEYASR